MPARGPGKSATLSATTSKPNAAKRAGSPLALMISPSHCGFNRAITRSRMVRPAIRRIGLSPPPIRRARPPASSTPGISGAPLGVANAPPDAALVVTRFALALVARGFFLDIVEVLVEHEPLLTRQRNEALATRAADKGQSDLPRELHA